MKTKKENGIILYQCNKCKGWFKKKEMITAYERSKREIQPICKKCHYAKKKERFKLDFNGNISYHMTKERKFKHKKVGDKVKGIAKNWGKPRYRRACGE